MFRYGFFIFLIVSSIFLTTAQEEDLQIKADSISPITADYIAQKPIKAGFYSAILPGLGQAYNKRYWKVPIVYLALGGSVYLYQYHQDKYQYYRSLYQLEITDEDATEYSSATLETIQKFHKKKRDGNLILLAGVYILQIVEASVDAHLQYHDVSKTLSLSPDVFQPNPKESLSYGFKLTYSF